jgi:hypothetical protein
MNSTVCTLFEGHYHHGLAALTNSLYQHGFRGNVWVGYRGALPPWVHDVKERDGTQCFEAAEGLMLRFQQVETKRHFTNYKPEFMAGLRDRYLSEAETLFYFDPDIVVKTEWTFFEGWADAGIALCEDVNSPMHSTHPIRAMWLRFYEPHGVSIARELDVYVNAGFVGVSPKNRSFIETWRQLLRLMDAETHGLAELEVKSRVYPFHKPDQDALNMAAMVSECPVSIVGKEGMDLIPGGYTMCHALGSPKPWAKAFVREALRGYPPTMADHSFWKYATSPIEIFPAAIRRRKRLELLTACAVARFYARP